MSLLISTLGRYLTWRFFKTIAAVFLAIVGTIYVFDFVELLRRANSIPGITSGYIAWLTLLRTPVVAEQILPFCILFGTMAAFIDLTRKLELIVARSAGVSVWQFPAAARCHRPAHRDFVGRRLQSAIGAHETTRRCHRSAAFWPRRYGSGRRHALDSPERH